MAAVQGDPGWGHALRTGWRQLLVPLPFFRGRREGAGTDALTALRILFLSTSVANVVVVLLTLMVSRGGSNDEPSVTPGVFLVLMAALGVGGVVLLTTSILRKPPPQDAGPDDVAGWFRSVTLLGHSLALVPFLIGFVGVFVTNEWAMVLAGLGFAAVGYGLTAPTKRRLASAQQRLDRAGLSVDLVRALVSSPVTPGVASGRSRNDEGKATPPRS